MSTFQNSPADWNDKVITVSPGSKFPHVGRRDPSQSIATTRKHWSIASRSTMVGHRTPATPLDLGGWSCMALLSISLYLGLSSHWSVEQVRRISRFWHMDSKDSWAAPHLSLLLLDGFPKDIGLW
jgi:hypothetical protein